MLRPIQRPKKTTAKTKPEINARAFDPRKHMDPRAYAYEGAAGRRPDPTAKCEVVARASGPAEINLYGEIGPWGVTAEAFKRVLDTVSADELILNINSPGGDVFDGFAIYQDLLAHKAYVVVRVTGLAASAASVIALAGNKVEIAEHAFFMIHNAWSYAIGDARAMTARAKLLKKIDGEIVDIYATKTGGDPTEIKTQMDDETWLTGSEAVEQGFADEAISFEDEDADNVVDLKSFKNVPRALKERRTLAKTKPKEKPAAPVAEELSLSSVLAGLDSLFVQSKAVLAA